MNLLPRCSLVWPVVASVCALACSSSKSDSNSVTTEMTSGGTTGTGPTGSDDATGGAPGGSPGTSNGGSSNQPPSDDGGGGMTQSGTGGETSPTGGAAGMGDVETPTGGMSGGGAAGASENGGGASSGEGGGAGGMMQPTDLDDFSFFVTSLAGLRKLSGNDQGFGGNLTYDGKPGIEGADHICATLAEESMPGAGAKGWRAFLSTTKEDAIDRVGAGPWYDRNGRLIAENVEGLLSQRPSGNAAAGRDLPNEFGVPNSKPDGQELDNHDTMTGSGMDGRLLVRDGPRGFSTCKDWTSTEPGQSPPMLGHSWPAPSGQHWIEVGRHANGCEAVVHLEETGGAENSCGRTGVGCGGGYGGFYCFALVR